MKPHLGIFLAAFTLAASSCIHSSCGGVGGDGHGNNDSTVTLERIGALRDETATRYRSYQRSMGVDSAKAAVAQWLKSQAIVRDAGIAVDGSAIWMTLKDGRQVVVITE